MAATRDENNDATPTPTRLSTLNRRCLHELKGAQYYSFTSFEFELSRLMMYLFFALPRRPARGTVPLREKVYSEIREYIYKRNAFSGIVDPTCVTLLHLVI